MPHRRRTHAPRQGPGDPQRRAELSRGHHDRLAGRRTVAADAAPGRRGRAGARHQHDSKDIQLAPRRADIIDGRVVSSAGRGVAGPRTDGESAPTRHDASAAPPGWRWPRPGVRIRSSPEKARAFTRTPDGAITTWRRSRGRSRERAGALRRRNALSRRSSTPPRSDGSRARHERYNAFADKHVARARAERVRRLRPRARSHARATRSLYRPCLCAAR